MYKLKKSGLLRKNKSFQAVYKLGKSYANKYAVLYVLPTRGAERRVGFVTGKRLGGAVVRNRIKRRFKEAYRLNQQRLADNVDLIVIGRQPIAKADSAIISKAFLDLCGRAKLLVK